jgi:hypothetical protein
MLSTEIFEKILGKDIIFIFMTFCGPIQGMNLRNLAWHGFLSSEVFPPHFSSFLMIFILSLHDYFKKFLNLNRRLLLDDQKWISNLNFPLKIPPFKKSTEEMISIKNIINNSEIIPKFQKYDWIHSFELFFQGENYNSLILLFPLLEHRFFVYSLNLVFDGKSNY